MRIITTGTLLVFFALSSFPSEKPARFHVVVIAETGGIHEPFVIAARSWLLKLATDSSFSIEYIENTEKIDSAYLSNCQLFIQLNYPPYMWTKTAISAFEDYISSGKSGGWIGFHHAGLLGEFDGYPMWQWFSDFMGGIRYTNYIAGFASGKVNVEDKLHPCMQSVPAAFEVEKDEWYTWSKSPRGKVHVLAAVDEASYNPQCNLKMGDHPVIWTNENMKARNIYIFMGHDPGLFANSAFTTIFRNSIFWAASKKSAKSLDY
jgi:type 1 glutamine amidotransferase